MWSVRSRLWLALALAVSMTVAIPASVGAKTVEKSETHCVIHVMEKTDEGELKMSTPTCFATQERAAAAAGREILKPQLNEAAGESYALSSFTIGIHYNGFNGSGSSITVVGSSCTGGWWNTPTWFDNKTSSSYNGCYRLRHYDRPNKQGSSFNTYGVGQIDNITGSMNNRTESVAYYSS